MQVRDLIEKLKEKDPYAYVVIHLQACDEDGDPEFVEKLVDHLVDSRFNDMPAVLLEV